MKKKYESVEKLQVLSTSQGQFFVSRDWGRMNAYEFTPLPTTRMEENFDGLHAESFYERLKEQVSRLPSDYHGQILVLRDEVGDLEQPVASGIFKPSGFRTSFILLEHDTGRIGEVSLASILLELGLVVNTLKSDRLENLSYEMIFSSTESKSKTPDLMWEGTHVKAGNRYLRIVSLTEAPDLTWPGFLQSVFEIESSFVLSLQISVPDKRKTKKDFESKRKITYALSAKKVDQIDDVDADSDWEATHQTLLRMTQGKESLLKVSLAIGVFSHDLLELNLKADSLAKELSGETNCGFYLEELGCFPVLQSHLPGARALDPREFLILSGNFVHFLPTFYDFNRSQEKTNLSVVSRSQELCHLNLFDSKNLNFNAFICGASGSGKSFLVNAMLASHYEKHPSAKAFIFDMGGSYRKLTESLGGSHLSFSASEAQRCILEKLKSTAHSGDEFLRVLLESFCGDKSELTHSHRSAIRTLTPRFLGRDFLFQDFIKFARERPEPAFQDLALWIEPHLAWDEISFKSSNTEKADHIASFDFKDLDTDPLLQRLSVLCLAKSIWETTRDTSSNSTFVVFDEVWKFFASSSYVLEEMYRTFRKYNAGIISITQNIADYADKNFSQLVVTNSYMRIILQGGASSAHLAEALDLNTDDLHRILSLSSYKNKFSEFWVGTPDFSQIMRLVPSQKLFELAHTNRNVLTEGRAV